MAVRRYEILLPAKFNDGREVMAACRQCFPATLMAVTDHFGSFSYDPGAIEGVWTKEGHSYRDRLFLLIIDVDDTSEHPQWMKSFKGELLRRFHQLEIYMTSHVIEVL